MTGIEIRDLMGKSEFEAAEGLQRAVWGADDLPDPYDLMMVIQHEGGLVAGAFQGAELLGYVFGFPTQERHIQHSHRLAVLPQVRGMGLGGRLKWYQRDWCLARGITHVRWTFDPSRIANARLNIGQLGAVVETYFPDYYGEMAGINAGCPSDRLLANWHLDSQHVKERSAGRKACYAPGTVRVTIPPDFAELLTADPAQALKERLRVRSEIQQALAYGLSICDFDPESACYIMAPIGSAVDFGVP